VPGKVSVSLPTDAAADYAHVFSVGPKRTNAVLLDIDDLPEFCSDENTGKFIALPAMLNGRIDKPGQVDEWRWQGKKADTWEFELRSAKLGSRLDGVVTICDREGKALAKGEASATDPVRRLQVAADGEYSVKIQDRFRSRGGPEFAYRLRVAPPAPADFRLSFPNDAITLPRKGSAKFKINVERLGGFREPITLDVRGLPEGVSAAPTTINPDQPTIDVTFSDGLQPSIHPQILAKIGLSRVTIIGKAKDVERTAKLKVSRGMPEQSSVLLAVALQTPFVIKGEYDMGFAARGGMHKRKYKIERN